MAVSYTHLDVYKRQVWSGYDNNEKLPDYARNFHKALWKKVMTRIHEGLPSKEFEKPASVETVSYTHLFSSTTRNMASSLVRKVKKPSFVHGT